MSNDNPFRVRIGMHDMFFDRAGVIKATEERERRVLSQIGAFVRRSARTSLRKRRKPSDPGSPPSVRTSDARVTLRNIQFSYEPRRQSVVIGPVMFNQVNMSTTTRSNIPVPELHEFGGSVEILESRFRLRDGRRTAWRRRDLRRSVREGVEYRRRRAVYQPRPFMRPALDANASKIMELFEKVK